MEIKEYAVHAGHCCLKHGCKYGDKDCPVTNNLIKQKFPCENCYQEEQNIKERHDSLAKEGTYYKLGLDVHGVIDTNPKFFSFLSDAVVMSGGEVHIITGHINNKKLKKKLELYKITYTHIFSISDYHKDIMTLDEKGNPWMDEEIWDRSKGEYCSRMNINMHIDDSDVYGKYFTTPYLKYQKRT